MFKKILIANRGEIACRVMRTAHRLGIATVAVYSDADANALHVTMADEAVHIGPAPARESYLCADKVIAAAQRTGAEAIHPGYGFLSENADFCRACAQANIVFIGPPTAAIEAMGSKSAAKTIMAKAQVPLVPGYHGDDQSPALLKQAAEDMGYPVLLKAVAGGGGKGMRQVWSADQFDEELAAAQRESLSSFGNSDMLVEKYLTQPRHVEIQVFCDSHGGGIYLAERDCSVQRRHQKVIEEAPAPNLPASLRVAMGEAAVQAASAIDYCGAGTVEFLLDTDGSFYFMEMNTRLQVEHPVTEMVTGLDLVEWQLRIAAGEPLPLQQAQVQVNGHAFEARIYAEDPAQDFMPATGLLGFLQTPVETDVVRVDTGVRQGDEVSIYYDPMIAKLIVWGENRQQALQRLALALTQYRIAGLTTNIDFLYNLATSAPFQAIELDTGFIERHQTLLLQPPAGDPEEQLGLAALYILLDRERVAQASANQSADPSSPWHSTGGWRMNEPHLQALALTYAGETWLISAEQVRNSSGSSYNLSFESGNRLNVSGQLNGDELSANSDGFKQKLVVAEHDGLFSAYGSSGAFQFATALPDTGEADAGGPGGNPRAPMNGRIVALLAEVGSAVAADAPLLVMEAMKMEYTIRASSAGSVTAFYYQPGELVDGAAELLNFEPEA
ncbi:acetyl/propionyl/methylcrotonyl-CoA carboxylase subunit alpha [Halieaceae bacterium IMCC14734]|uniref:Acetyl/propionyl/methylcrotonyl-CoA carboxylase subunit alpha n=1 Tax=Candidatus Litorirhabdus singularis TaxID=2518993 RepID=A0ABT3TCD3_9GAMM|nr:acetyl/propionyl/methylcrotonyl-CoA carboxylase subunit alpha [Candidatus Litorirhabdus singularis]MCX2979471.1 acetyl/propionyl/methylcrotonyl-CoA carboxylase subunit alpha [Candidatus Litorirhabdus singularis]